MLALLNYWTEFPPEHELLRGFVGYKPPVHLPEAKDSNSLPAIRSAFGRQVNDSSYEQLPQWLRDMHAAQKKS